MGMRYSEMSDCGEQSRNAALIRAEKAKHEVAGALTCNLGMRISAVSDCGEQSRNAAAMASEAYDIRRSGAIGHAEKAKHEAAGALICNWGMKGYL